MYSRCMWFDGFVRGGSGTGRWAVTGVNKARLTVNTVPVNQVNFEDIMFYQ